MPLPLPYFILFCFAFAHPLSDGLLYRWQRLLCVYIYIYVYIYCTHALSIIILVESASGNRIEIKNNKVFVLYQSFHLPLASKFFIFYFFLAPGFALELLTQSL